MCALNIRTDPGPLQAVEFSWGRLCSGDLEDRLTTLMTLALAA